MHCGCIIYRNHAVAAVVVVVAAFPISIFLSKFAVAVQNLKEKSMSIIGILSSKKSG